MCKVYVSLLLNDLFTVKYWCRDIKCKNFKQIGINIFTFQSASNLSLPEVFRRGLQRFPPESKIMKHTINRIKRLHLFSYYPRPCSGVALIRRILPHTVILHMQLDILRELGTNSFECTDSDIQEGNPPLVTLPPYRRRRPPPPPPS